MSLVLTRIDNRLIHGQVLEAWVPTVNANCILVANDEVAGNPFQKLLMEAAVPSGLKVVISPIGDLACRYRQGEFADYRVLLLFAGSHDALIAHEQGLRFDDLNLGNMHAGEGKLRLCCTISLTKEDIENLQSLEQQGVRITSQCIPSDRGREWRKLLVSSGS